MATIGACPGLSGRPNSSRMTAATQRFVGASTPFGKVVAVSDRLFNPTATVEAQDGTVNTYRLPFLLALVVKLQEGMA